MPPSVSGNLDGIVRLDQTTTNPNNLVSSVVPNLINPSTVSYYAFGSFLSPRYQYASASGHQDNPYGTGDGYTDGEIPPVPTTQTPVPFAADRLGVIVVTPNPVSVAVNGSQILVAVNAVAFFLISLGPRQWTWTACDAIAINFSRSIGLLK